MTPSGGRRSVRADRPSPRGLGGDDRGAIQVFEAVLVALLVLSTLLIVNALQRPTTAREIGGVDLGQLSSDTLDILEDRTFTENGAQYNLTDWVEALMGGHDLQPGVRADLAEQVDEFLGAGSNGVLPLGTQYQLRVDNGEGQIRLLPPNLDRTPLDARAASTYVLPNWTKFSGEVPDLRVRPGAQEAFNTATGVDESVDFNGWTLTAPTNSTTGPDGEDWVDIWLDEEPDGQRIPRSALYGIWEYNDGVSACSPECYLEVTLPDGSSFDRPLYGLQLVVWYGA